MKKSIPGFSGDVKPGKIDVPSGAKQGTKSQPPVSPSNGKGHGMPKGGMIPSKV
jgi:hypothetical protein